LPDCLGSVIETNRSANCSLPSVSMSHPKKTEYYRDQTPVHSPLPTA
jgi:hypothetical protein